MTKTKPNQDVAQLGSALASGVRSREFKSHRPGHFIKRKRMIMKKSFLIPTVLLTLLASACTFSININDDSSSSSKPSSNSSETSHGGESSQGSTSTNITPSDGKILLGDYGDYVEFEDGHDDTDALAERFTDLSSKVKGSVTGVLQSDYQKGALEFFNINNKITFKVNITEQQLNYLNSDYERNNHETYRQCTLDINYLGLHFHYEGVEVTFDLISYLKEHENDSEDIFVIGGKQIYVLALPYAKRLYITHIDKEFDGDIYFPKIDYDKYNVISSNKVNELNFVIYERK